MEDPEKNESQAVANGNDLGPRSVGDPTTKQVEAFLHKDALWMAFALAVAGQLRQLPWKTLITAICGSPFAAKVAAHYLGL